MPKQEKPRYEVGPGREILREGQPIAFVGRVTLDSGNCALTPVESDELTRYIVALLNLHSGVKK